MSLKLRSSWTSYLNWGRRYSAMFVTGESLWHLWCALMTSCMFYRTVVRFLPLSEFVLFQQNNYIAQRNSNANAFEFVHIWTPKFNSLSVFSCETYNVPSVSCLMWVSSLWSSSVTWWKEQGWVCHGSSQLQVPPQ